MRKRNTQPKPYMSSDGYMTYDRKDPDNPIKIKQTDMTREFNGEVFELEGILNFSSAKAQLKIDQIKKIRKEEGRKLRVIKKSTGYYLYSN